ncbi:PspA/IM30 family protein [Roseofilum sp. BLCC_M154]|uniref:PspA/IM30 family protein n=1 Tax=Roseofilum acuticapitatum BLCC-M154 TaxID=3022444 RepID=A0ABT7AY87_9CYAN|nr:PspA/IM30 family protein [Roseofilum acuticapitatum]MDJ1171867.1 PspA/IM30 family protein [Roseofilum acuticapitatum BLCC-M154]
MSVVDRLIRAVRAQVNDWITQRQDPEKLLETAILELQDDLVSLRQSVAQAIAVQKRTERQYDRATRSAEDWHKRAELALEKQDETLAREALTRRKPYLETARLFQEHLQQQGVVVDRMKQDLRTLEGKIAEAKAKKDLYIARARAAKTSEQLHQVMNQLHPRGTLAALERMENKVHQLEAQAELAQWGQDPVEKEFQALESGEQNSVEEELTAIKTQLKSQGTRSESEYDRELEELRSRLNEL